MSLSTLTALAVLEGPRSPEGKPNTIIFDGQIYLGGERSLVAGLRYYNESGIVFDGITICHIVANVRHYHRTNEWTADWTADRKIHPGSLCPSSIGDGQG